MPDRTGGVTTLEPAITQTAHEIHRELGGRRMTPDWPHDLFGYVSGGGEG